MPLTLRQILSLPDEFVPHIPAKVLGDYLDNPTQQGLRNIVFWAKAKLLTYEGGDRPPSPPVWLLRLLDWAGVANIPDETPRPTIVIHISASGTAPVGVSTIVDVLTRNNRKYTLEIYSGYEHDIPHRRGILWCHTTSKLKLNPPPADVTIKLRRVLPARNSDSVSLDGQDIRVSRAFLVATPEEIFKRDDDLAKQIFTFIDAVHDKHTLPKLDVLIKRPLQKLDVLIVGDDGARKNHVRMSIAGHFPEYVRLLRRRKISKTRSSSSIPSRGLCCCSQNVRGT